MKFETFKAGAWTPRYQYKSFEPMPVDHAWVWVCPVLAVLGFMGFAIVFKRKPDLLIH